MPPSPLKEKDWLVLLDAIRRLHEPAGPAELAARMLAVVRGIVPCDHASYDEVDMARHTTVGLCSDPAVDAQWPAIQEAAAAYFHEHPVLHHFAQHPNDGPRRLSDFLPNGKFHETGLYQECYRYIHVDHQLVTRLPGEAGLEVGIAMNRSRHDFSERDRQCLELLRPHLEQAYHQCLVGVRLRELTLAMTDAVETLPQGLIVLDGRSRMVTSSSRARELVERYFPSENPADHLPEPLQHWLGELDRGPSRAGEVIANPWLVANGEGRLSIFAVSGVMSSARVLWLQEQSPDDAIRRLRQLGLTPRQTEVLYWVSHGKSNAEVASLLHMSPRTVQKHLESIFKVLDVETRTMAGVKAMAIINHWRQSPDA